MLRSWSWPSVELVGRGRGRSEFLSRTSHRIPFTSTHRYEELGREVVYKLENLMELQKLSAREWFEQVLTDS